MKPRILISNDDGEHAPVVPTGVRASLPANTSARVECSIAAQYMTHPHARRRRRRCRRHHGAGPHRPHRRPARRRLLRLHRVRPCGGALRTEPLHHHRQAPARLGAAGGGSRGGLCSGRHARSVCCGRLLPCLPAWLLRGSWAQCQDMNTDHCRCAQRATCESSP